MVIGRGKFIPLHLKLEGCAIQRYRYNYCSFRKNSYMVKLRLYVTAQRQLLTIQNKKIIQAIKKCLQNPNN